MKYYNKIKKKKTKFRYRFKTKDEFINQYGDDWRYCVRNSFIEDMDYLFGVDLEDDIDYNSELNYKLHKQDYKLHKQTSNYHWNISNDMLIENYLSSFSNIYNKKQLNYE